MAHGEYNHIEIPYDDEDRATAFYSGVFGWQFRQMDGFEGYNLYTAGPGDLGGGLGKRGDSAGDATRTYILVDSLDAAVEKVTALGGTITTPKSPVANIGWYAAGTDSEGNPLALYERAPVG